MRTHGSLAAAPGPARTAHAPGPCAQAFDLPCQPADFWCHFLRNGSDFLATLHARRGDTNIRISKWQRHYKASRARGSPRCLQVCRRLAPHRAAAQVAACLPAMLVEHCGAALAHQPTGVPSCCLLPLPAPLPQVGLVRDLQFVSPVKARIGPPQAMCHQTQRLQVRQR